MQAAYAARPNMPGMMLRLAGAHAVNGQPDKALPLLERIAAMGLVFNLAADPDFAGLKDTPRFLAITAAMSANRQPLIKSIPAFELPEKDFLAEGLAHDSRTGNFYIASVYKRKIVKRLPSGEVEPFANTPADGLWSVLAITVDATRRLLWAASAAMDQTRGIDANDSGDIGRTAIFQYDLDREKLIARFELPDRKAKRVFGDLLLAGNGDLYISESVEGGIFRIAGNALTTFIAPGTFASPQGMAWAGNGKWLYAADYSLGLLRIDIETRRVEWLPPPADACLLGLDGLVQIGAPYIVGPRIGDQPRDGQTRGDRLIATQNGINPQRVVQIDLDEKGQVKKVTALEASHPRYDEPTLGVIVDDAFFYVANSQWELFERGKPPPLDRLAAPVILRLPLAKP
jgi:hypothetical protein